MRAGIKKQLNFLGRDLKYIEEMRKTSQVRLSLLKENQLKVLKTVYSQQKEMIDKRTHSVADRIASISQPHVRPIPRGKAKTKTEFGAKVEISIFNGFTIIETLSFDPYNEGRIFIHFHILQKESARVFDENIKNPCTYYINF